MATGTYAPDPFEQYCDDDGNPLSSGSLTVYSAGTSTPVNTYSDVNLTTPNTNPISLDAAGRPTSGAIFLTPGISYKFVLKDVLGATVATRDNIAAVPVNPNVSGTWIPLVGGTTATSGQTYSQQVGSYVKLGTLVIAFYTIQLLDKGLIAGILEIQGLPFTPSIGTAGTVGFWQNTNTSLVEMSWFLTANVSNNAAVFTGIAAAGTTNVVTLTTTDITNTFTVSGVIIYTTAN